MRELSTKEIVIGVLLIPVMAAFVLSGMALANEEVTRTSVSVFAASTIALFILVLLARHEGRRFYE